MKCHLELKFLFGLVILLSFISSGNGFFFHLFRKGRSHKRPYSTYGKPQYRPRPIIQNTNHNSNNHYHQNNHHSHTSSCGWKPYYGPQYHTQKPVTVTSLGLSNIQTHPTRKPYQPLYNSNQDSSIYGKPHLTTLRPNNANSIFVSYSSSSGGGNQQQSQYSQSNSLIQNTSPTRSPYAHIDGYGPPNYQPPAPIGTSGLPTVSSSYSNVAPVSSTRSPIATYSTFNQNGDGNSNAIISSSQGTSHGSPSEQEEGRNPWNAPALTYFQVDPPFSPDSNRESSLSYSSNNENEYGAPGSNNINYISDSSFSSSSSQNANTNSHSSSGGQLLENNVDSGTSEFQSTFTNGNDDQFLDDPFPPKLNSYYFGNSVSSTTQRPVTISSLSSKPGGSSQGSFIGGLNTMGSSDSSQSSFQNTFSSSQYYNGNSNNNNNSNDDEVGVNFDSFDSSVTNNPSSDSIFTQGYSNGNAQSFINNDQYDTNSQTSSIIQSNQNPSSNQNVPSSSFSQSFQSGSDSKNNQFNGDNFNQRPLTSIQTNQNIILSVNRPGGVLFTTTTRYPFIQLNNENNNNNSPSSIYGFPSSGSSFTTTRRPTFNNVFVNSNKESIFPNSINSPNQSPNGIVTTTTTQYPYIQLNPVIDNTAIVFPSSESSFTTTRRPTYNNALSNQDKESISSIPIQGNVFFQPTTRTTTTTSTRSPIFQSNNNVIAPPSGYGPPNFKPPAPVSLPPKDVTDLPITIVSQFPTLPAPEPENGNLLENYEPTTRPTVAPASTTTQTGSTMWVIDGENKPIMINLSSSINVDEVIQTTTSIMEETTTGTISTTPFIPSTTIQIDTTAITDSTSTDSVTTTLSPTTNEVASTTEMTTTNEMATTTESDLSTTTERVEEERKAKDFNYPSIISQIDESPNWPWTSQSPPNQEEPDVHTLTTTADLSGKWFRRPSEGGLRTAKEFQALTSFLMNETSSVDDQSDGDYSLYEDYEDESSFNGIEEERQEKSSPSKTEESNTTFRPDDLVVFYPLRGKPFLSFVPKIEFADIAATS